jgi:alginate O-acetyltransferase complex protein AlgI
MRRVLFNSYSFLLLFLPVTLAGFWWLQRSSHPAARTTEWPLAWLVLCSLVYYGWCC